MMDSNKNWFRMALLLTPIAFRTSIYRVRSATAINIILTKQMATPVHSPIKNPIYQHDSFAQVIKHTIS